MQVWYLTFIHSQTYIPYTFLNREQKARFCDRFGEILFARRGQIPYKHCILPPQKNLTTHLLPAHVEENCCYIYIYQIFREQKRNLVVLGNSELPTTGSSLSLSQHQWRTSGTPVQCRQWLSCSTSNDICRIAFMTLRSCQSLLMRYTFKIKYPWHKLIS